MTTISTLIKRRGDARGDGAVVVPTSPGDRPRYDDPAVLARVMALKTAATPELRQQWRLLFTTEPPPYNRKFLESRLAYRIQELAFGGLKPETKEHLRELGEQFDGGSKTTRRIRQGDKPIAGTRLIREWQGIEQTVIVLDEGYDWQGRRYESLSSVARAITGTRWNGWTFFGLKNYRGRP